MLGYFRKLFQIDEGESQTFTLLALTFFLIIAGNYTIGRSVSRSLFLSNLPPEYIPYRYLIVTAGVVLATLAYARYNGRFRRLPFSGIAGLQRNSADPGRQRYLSQCA